MARENVSSLPPSLATSHCSSNSPHESLGLACRYSVPSDLASLLRKSETQVRWEDEAFHIDDSSYWVLDTFAL